ncbi:hypothetical protein ACFL7D_08390 [candidate division KSB1 bacterium]
MNLVLDSLSGSFFNEDLKTTQEDADLINNLENAPPVPVKPEDVYVRKCRLTGDGVNCHFGRFHTEDLPLLLKKTQGVSCLIGHRKETAGIARFFGGSIEQHKAKSVITGKMEEMSFIVPKIYWMKSHSKAEDLKVNIDGGIYHQASISWYFEQPVCGICGKDIRMCDHVPGRLYNGKLCFFWYEKIGNVLEGSIVYAGGHPGTGFKLNNNVKEEAENQEKIFKLEKNGKIEKRDIFPYLRNINDGNIYIIGDLAGKGWTNDKINIIADRRTKDLICNIIPAYLTDRVCFHQELDKPQTCIKIDPDSVLEIENIYPPGLFPPKDNVNGHQKDLLFSDSELLSKPSKKIFSLDQIDSANTDLLIVPYYEGIPAMVSVSGFQNSKNIEPKTLNISKTVQIEFPEKLKVHENICTSLSADLIDELFGMNLPDCRIFAYLVAYRGKSRIELTDLFEREKLSGFRIKPFLKIVDVEFKDKCAIEISERVREFEKVLPDSESISIIPHKTISGNQITSKTIQLTGTKQGIEILENKTDFGNYSNRKFLFGLAVINIAVAGKEAKKNGWIYKAEILKNGESVKIGSTLIHKKEYNTGDILSVGVGSINIREDNISWHSPQVLKKCVIEDEPDNFEVIENLYQAKFSSSYTHDLNIERANLKKSTDTNDTQNSRIFNQYIIEECSDEKLFFSDKPPVSLKSGFVCPVIPETDIEKKISEIFNVKKTAGTGSVNSNFIIINWESSERIVAFSGELINGIYRFLRIKKDGRDHWYVKKCNILN